MKSKMAIGLTAATVLALGTLGACGDDTGTTSSPASSGSTTGGGNAGTDLNGCTDANTEDMTGMPAITINFGGALGNTYDPACVRVDAGTEVTFAGSFTTHPLQGGIEGTPDSSSDIPATSTGMSAMVTLATADDYPYYCTIHQGLGMQGAIFVQ